MPLFRCNHEIHYFAHVPKCGGRSVEAYLNTRFGSLALLDDHFFDKPARKRWTRSSPQHLDVETFDRLIPRDWIKSSFAIVRHPVARIVSAYNFAAMVTSTIPNRMDLDEWLSDFLARRKRQPYSYENHLCPQSDQVPSDAHVFKLEDGTKAVVRHLNALEGIRRGPDEIAKKPEADLRTKRFHMQTLSKTTLRKIYNAFASDFERFGYDFDPSSEYIIKVPHQFRVKQLSSVSRIINYTKPTRAFARLSRIGFAFDRGF